LGSQGRPAIEDFLDAAWFALQKKLPPKQYENENRFASQAISRRQCAGCLCVAGAPYLWAVIAVLAAYSSDIYLWSGPENFDARALDVELIERSVKYRVRVADIRRLVAFMNSDSLSNLGEVYAGGPHFAFVVGTTAYTITNSLG
jgi:hypothetical protein